MRAARNALSASESSRTTASERSFRPFVHTAFLLRSHMCMALAHVLLAAALLHHADHLAPCVHLPTPVVALHNDALPVLVELGEENVELPWLTTQTYLVHDARTVKCDAARLHLSERVSVQALDKGGSSGANKGLNWRCSLANGAFWAGREPVVRVALTARPCGARSAFVSRSKCTIGA